MTKASAERVQKMVGNKKKNAHPTQSFAQLMSDAQLNALKPYIEQQVIRGSQQIVTGLYRVILEERAAMQTRQMAFERLLKLNCPWFSDELLALTVAEVEDESAKLEAVAGEIQEGDKVRLEYSVKAYNETDFTPVDKLVIHTVNVKGPNGTVQTYPELESNLVGLHSGETKEFVVPEIVEEGREPENTKVKVTVIRVSRKVAPKDAGVNNE